MSEPNGYEPGDEVLRSVGLDPQADSPEATLAAAAGIAVALNRGNLSTAELKALMAAMRNTPEYRAKAARLAAIPPADAADRRRWEANGRRPTPRPNRHRAEQAALAGVEAALGAAIHGSAPIEEVLAAVEAAEDEAMLVMARDRIARAGGRRSGAGGEASGEGGATRSGAGAGGSPAQARAEARAADGALADFLAEHGIPERTPIVGIFPLAVRHTVQDLAQRAALATERLNQRSRRERGSPDSPGSPTTSSSRRRCSACSPASGRRKRGPDDNQSRPARGPRRRAAGPVRPEGRAPRSPTHAGEDHRRREGPGSR